MRDTLHSTITGALFALICGALFVSCDLLNGGFLDRSARGAVDEDLVDEKPGGVERLLNGTYSALSTGSGVSTSPWFSSQDNWIYGSVAGGEAYKGSVPGDQATILTIAKMEHDATQGAFDGLWQALYRGVDRANTTLSAVADADNLSEHEATRMEGEARFLRAHFYFELKKNFGNVPWIDETTDDPNQPNTGSGHPNIWQKIEKDFRFAMNHLPAQQIDAGRANKWAAAAYLAKTHLYQEEWQAARELFTRVVDQGTNPNGEPYALTPAYYDMFNAATETNSGTVFSVQNTGPDGSGGVASNGRFGSVLSYPHGSASPWGCCGFFQPSQWLVNSFRTGPDGLPTLDRSAGPPVKSDQGIDDREPFSLGAQTLDPRLDWTVGRRGVPYHDWGPHPGARWIREQAVGGPYAPKKHVFQRSQDGTLGDSADNGTGVNYKVIRFADVLLMAAEAEAEIGRLQQARAYVNRVRRRAARPESKVTNDLNEAFALAVVDDEADMLATDASSFEWVVRTDRNSTFVFLGGDPSDISNWNEYVVPNYKVEPYPASAFSSAEEALRRIRFERMLELGMEGHRFYDLVRWGIADRQLEAYYAFETSSAGGFVKSNLRGGNFTPNKNERYPIPLRQIELSTGVLQQNPGY